MLMGQEAFAEKVNAAILLGWEPQCSMAVRGALGDHSKGRDRLLIDPSANHLLPAPLLFTRRKTDKRLCRHSLLHTTPGRPDQ